MSKIKAFAEFDFTPIEPHQIVEIYESGFMGAMPESNLTAAFARFGANSFYDAFPAAKGIHKEMEYCFPVRACQVLLDPDFYADRSEAQREGNCVGTMIRNQGMVDGCMDALFGETEWPKGPDGKGLWYCSEPIYGERGHGGEGANCWRLWNAVSPDGGAGFLHRGKYGRYDLTKYTTIGGQWGSRGTPQEILDLCDDNPAFDQFKIRSIEEALDALTLGFGLGRCGSDGYSSKRNEDGLSEATTSWNHAIAVGGYVREQRILDKYGGPIFLYGHNWSLWNSGPKPWEISDGSWFVRQRQLESRIKAGECCAIAGLPGKNRKLVFERLMERREESVKKELMKWQSTHVSQSA